MQHSLSTFAFKPLILFPPTLYFLPLLPHLRLMLLAVSLYLMIPLLLPDFLRFLQWNVGGLRARSTKPLHFISSHPFDLICIQESNLNLSSSFRIADSLLCDLIAPNPGLVFFLLMSHTLAAASSFSLDWAYPL